jgi:hypothetical protein
MIDPDAPSRREGGVRRWPARVAWLLVLSVAFGTIAAPVLAEVSQNDIHDAEAVVSEAAARLRDAEDALDASRRREARLEDSLDSVEERLTVGEAEIEEGRREARDRIARMYMSAGTSEGPAWLAVGGIAQLPAHIGYLGAVARQDREVVNRLAVARGELLRLRTGIEAALAAQAAEIEELSAAVEARRAELEAARGDVDEVRAQWERQEAERRAREEAERRAREEEARRAREEEERKRQEAERRREEALAAMQAAAASATAAGWKPGAGVEPWRPLVEEHFPSGMVDDALRVMACESHGDPLIVNKYSAASGLFQHLPYYWPSRAQKAGWAGADIFDPEANIAVAAWLVDQTVRGGNPDPWAHWSCKP